MVDQVARFLEMGGYAAYVWPAFGVTALGLGGLLATTLRGLRARERALAAASEGAPPRRRHRAAAASAPTPAPTAGEPPLPGARS